MAFRSIAVWLEDVVMAIERIKEYTLSFEDYQEFEQNKKTVDAVERNFEKLPRP